MPSKTMIILLIDISCQKGITSHLWVILHHNMNPYISLTHKGKMYQCFIHNYLLKFYSMTCPDSSSIKRIVSGTANRCACDCLLLTLSFLVLTVNIWWSKKYQFSVFCMIPSENRLIFSEFWHETSKKRSKFSPPLQGCLPLLESAGTRPVDP